MIHRTSGHVLIVDDEPEIADLLAEALREEGMTASVAYDGVGALRRFEAEVVDVLVSDVRMPGFGGLELLRQVRRRKPSTPVILISGFSDLTIEDDVGPKAIVFSKPFDFDALVAEIRRVLTVPG